MKLLMTTDSVGGVWAYSMELCRALGAHGHEVVLASMGGPLGAPAREEAAGLANVELHESSYRLEWMDDPWREVELASRWLDCLQQSTRAELLHLNCYGPAAGRYEVPILVVAHSCVHSWWQATHGEAPPPRWRRYRRCVLDALGRADGIVVPTTAFLEVLRSCYGEVDFDGRARVIHNGVDAARWPADGSSRKPFVLGVGRVWDAAKNLQQLARIAPRLGCPVLIAGDGGLETPTQEVVLLGARPRSQLLSFYRTAAVFAHPARYEPFGLAVLEAALCGCPLLLGDIPTLRELWDGAAEFADPDDTETWRRRLSALLADADARRDQGRAARERALRYSARRMATAYSAQYRRLLHEPLEAMA